jgi:hypothetical protein
VAAVVKTSANASAFIPRNAWCPIISVFLSGLGSIFPIVWPLAKLAGLSSST